MTTKYRLSREQPINWPRKCAICGTTDVTFVHTYASKLTSVMPFVLWTTVKWKTQPLSFPVCSKHKSEIDLVRFFAPHSLIWFLLFLWTTVVVIDALTIQTLWGGGSPKAAPYLVAVSAVIVWLRTLLPVSIRAFDDKSVTFVFRNDRYAQEFETANTNAILEKDGSAYGVRQK